MTTHKLLPSEPTFEMVNAGVTVWLYQENPNKPINFVEIFKAMWEKASVVEQEPAVYLVWHDGEFTYTKHPEEYQNTYEALPLYTHPQPKREPMNFNDMANIIKQLPHVSFTQDTEDLIRAVERFHKIGE